MALIIGIVSLLIIIQQAVSFTFLPETFLKTPELIKHWGYPVETHEAITKDGYILTLHRIPYGKGKTAPASNNRPVFYLQHPMFGSSSDWVINLPNQSLGFMLADRGYDVWLGNVRGNTYSQKHVTMSNMTKEFWDFSFDEHALFDFPAIINYVLKHTKQRQLYYVGHSQGTMMSFAGLSNNKALQSKIKINFALGPIARINSITLDHKVRSVAILINYIKRSFDLLNVFVIGSPLVEAREAMDKLCNSLPSVCAYLSAIKNDQIAGSSPFLNVTRLPVYFTHAPSGTSTKNFLHRLQLVNSGRFCMYDYGKKGNLMKYKKLTPPEYDLKAVAVPTVIFSGTADTLSTPKDVLRTVRSLPNVLHHYNVTGYNHGDFLLAMNAGTAVNKKIIEHLP